MQLNMYYSIIDGKASYHRVSIAADHCLISKQYCTGPFTLYIIIVTYTLTYKRI